MRSAWVLLLAVGCVRSETVDCGDGRLCASGQICVHATAEVTVCAPPDSRGACAGAGLADGEACDDAKGRCYDGACLPITCGDLLVDPAAEQCDDGNNKPGDACSADCRSNETCGNGVVDPIAGEICDDGNLVGRDGCTGACTLETVHWTPVSLGVPPADSPMGMVYLPGRARVVGTFEEPSGFATSTWEWNGTGWQRLATTLSPPPRSFYSSVADLARDVFMIIGGTAGGPSQTDLWELGGDRWGVGASMLVGRFGAAVAYDPQRERVVVVGGRDDGGVISILLDDMYEWNGASATTVMPSGMKPSPRYGAAMVYDPRRDELVLFGGTDNATKPLEDTWTFKAGAWTRHMVSGPAGRVYARMVVDRTGVLLYGGSDGTADLSDAWRWDGAQWTSLGDQAPGKRSEFGLAYDSARDRVVLYGRSANSGTWEWDGTTWTKVVPTFPVIGEFAASAFDPLRHQGLVLAGSSMYAMRDGSWAVLSSAPAPTRSIAAMVYDVARDRAVVFGGVTTQGGALAETLAFAPQTAAWSTVATTARPPARGAHAMAYDTDRGVAVLFGGSDLIQPLADTWELDTDWHERTQTTGPPARSGHAMAYDPVRKQTILFGGTDFSHQFSDTWAWNGTTWTELHPTGRIPVARSDATLTWNPARRRVTLVGGRANTIGVIDDVWEWTGVAWSELKPASTPGPRAGHIAVPASDASGLYIAAGGNGGGVLGDEWLLSWSETDRLYERCLADTDRDGDNARGCADPDCWWACTPLCLPGLPCASSAPRCGDGTASPAETCRLCPVDVPACPTCGDLTCTAAESPGTCPGDCL